MMIVLAELLLHAVPHQDLRYQWVEEQSNTYTCGPAAVATLLTHFYALPTRESEALALAEGVMAGLGREPGHALTAYALKETLAAKGLPTKGFRVSQESLHDYFLRGGLPVIVHTESIHRHFSVAVGFVGDTLLLADPSWGLQLVPFDEFAEEYGYSEVVLVPVPPPALIQQAIRSQRGALTWASTQLSCLAQLREELP